MQLVQFTAARADTGQILPYGKCTVYLSGSNTLASLFDANGSAIANPAVADIAGQVSFQAGNGTYDAQLTSADGTYNFPSRIKLQFFDLAAVANALAAGTVAGVIAKIKDTRANLNADLAAAANALGLVYADPTAANNDLYVKLGASGSGSWFGPIGFLTNPQIRNGVIDPVNTVGADGDFYLNTVSMYFFGPKTGGVWAPGFSLLGTVTSATGQSVSTRALMSNIASPVAGQLAYLTESGREGAFVFSTANLSAMVTADPNMAVYIPPAFATSGASGAWVRKFSGSISALWYGAKGDGVTDDAPAIQAAVNANPGKRIVFPGARYLINTAIAITQAPVTLDFSGRQATLVLGTQNMNGIVIGDGTLAGKNATTGTRIIAPIFNVKAGLPAFTSGACIFRNYAAFDDVVDLQIYGADAGTPKLWNGVYDYMATECDTPNAVIQQVLNYGIQCKGDGTTAGRSVDCNYDNPTITDFGAKGIFIDAGCAGIGMYRPTIYSGGVGSWGIHVKVTAGPNGQNFFIDTPDVEAGPSAAGGIFLESGNKAIVKGGWIGASMGIGLKIGAGFDSCDVSPSLIQSKMVIDGVQNIVSGGEIVGDSATAGANGITISGNNNSIASGVKIRQWLGNGIAWSGTPSGSAVGQVAFSNNGTDIQSAAFTPSNAPVIAAYSTDKGRSYTAATSLDIPPGLSQVTGATPVTTLALKGSGSRITVQAGAGGISFTTAGNIVMSSTPLSVPAFQTASFVCDGSNWFLDGKSF